LANLSAIFCNSSTIRAIVLDLLRLSVIFMRIN
jgi:hypothetical protein